MTIHHRAARPEDLERLFPMLDNEFVLGKGRKTSLAQRYPSTFCAANASNIFLAEDDGDIVAAFLCRRFEWRLPGKTWHGAMVGAVYTNPKRRNEGIGSALLKWGTQTLQGAGVEFAVLWTTQPEFYARLGWGASDIGMLGSCDSGLDAGNAEDSVTELPLAPSNEREIDDIRMQCLDAYVQRHSLDYSQQPVPSESVSVLLRMDNNKPSGYALMGRVGDTGILYEMIGRESTFPDLWDAMQRRHKKIVINDNADSASYRWLSHNTPVSWEEKRLAMWLPLSSNADMSTMSRWYIPYFDRI